MATATNAVAVRSIRTELFNQNVFLQEATSHASGFCGSRLPDVIRFLGSILRVAPVLDS
ncbi:hypothetical protein BRCON_0467 [Candidatus Sumerlaea chitinivorans]|uniref:Uncharacterized protein n=1 Tax=Sumerlaea chitinivorans TaxID=2250252 RepID=A0A2Z4Y2G5_SUMC1|nr:hypothetical protein BRCON_0467 [Candidatus Sumerlaea chitinivorans]